MRRSTHFIRRGQVALPAQVTPLKLITSTTVLAWYRSDLGITLNGSSVTAWGDQSGNARHLVQAITANQPTYLSADAAFGGKPSITFDGVNDILGNVGGFSWAVVGPSFKPFIFMVLKQNAWGNGPNLFCTVSGGSGYVIHQSTLTPGLRMYDGVGANISNGATVGAVARVKANFTGSTSDFLKAGASNVTGTSAGNGFTGTDLYLGGAVSTAWASYSLVEWLACPMLPSTAELAAIDSYVVSRYPGVLV